MNTPSFLKNMTQLELTVAAVLALYIALPINAPNMVCELVDGPLGMIAVFTVAVYLFLYTNPILAVLFVFAGYELLRRCCKVTGNVVIAKHTPTQAKKDKKMKKMNPTKQSTLEEEVVQQMAPVGKSESSVFTSSSFSPVADNVGSASAY
jgi:hypothetical protein